MALGQQKSSGRDVGRAHLYLRAANVKDGVLDLHELLEMPFSDPDRYRLLPGDVLICEGLGSRDLVGRSASYHGDPPELMFQNHLLRFRAFPGVDSDYALLVFRVYQKTGVFAGIAKGIGISHIGLARFRDLPFPLPPTSVQRELALVATAIQDNLDLLSNAVTSALDELSDLMANARNSLILGADGPGWDGASAGDSPWPLTLAAQIVAPDAPIVYGIVQPGPEVEGGIPYVRGQDLQEGAILLDQLKHTSPEIGERYARSSLREGDVLLGIIRHTRVAVVPQELAGGNITQGSARLRPGPLCRSDFLAHWLASRAVQHWLRSRMRGIDMPGLNLRDVRQLPVPLPPLDVQAQIAGQLNEIAARAASLELSFTRLANALPDLERELLQSFAYGRHAAAISREIVADLEDELSRELLSSLKSGQALQSVPQPLYDALSERDDTLENVDARSGEVGTAVPRITGKVATTTAADIAQALAQSGRAVHPEELAELELAESAIDSFYAALRDLVQESLVEIIRPDDTEVTITLRSSP